MSASDMGGLMRSYGAGRTRRGRRMKGGSVWSWLKGAAGKVHDFVKSNKLVSKGLAMLPGPYAKAGALASGALGYGRRRRRRVYRRRAVRPLRRAVRRRPVRRASVRLGGRRRGGNAMRKFFWGFGRRPVRRARVRRVRRRGGNIGNLLKKAHAFVKQRRIVSGLLNHFGHKKLASASHALGYGRRRIRRRVYRRR